jgi:hypothetical protein
MVTYIKRWFKSLFANDGCSSNCTGNCNQGRNCDCR